MKMFVKFNDSKSSSQHFAIQKSHITVLRMDRGVRPLRCTIFKLSKDNFVCNGCCLQSALVTEVTGGTETPVTITFLPYEHGDAPVKIVNLCEDVFIKLHQK